MKLKKFEIYLADLSPRMGTEPGKVRPVVVVQTDLLSEAHPSTIICPITSQVVRDSDILRVHLTRKESGLDKDSDIIVDQIRAIDNRRIQNKIGSLNMPHRQKLLANLEIVVLR